MTAGNRPQQPCDRARPGRFAARRRGALLALFLACAQIAPPFLAALTIAATADEAEARSRTSSGSRSSSGYARSSSGRTPSYSGYAAPSRSTTDKTISRQNSFNALESYRQSREPAPTRTPTPAAPERRRDSEPARASSSTSERPSQRSSIDRPDNRPAGRSEQTQAPRRPSADVYAPYRRYDPRWTPPAYAVQGARRFGVWDAALLWFLFETLNRPGHAAFFHDNAEDPGVQAWRREAEQAAQDNGDLRGRLTALDAATAAQAGEPRRPGRVPDDVADQAAAGAAAANDDANDDGTGLIVGLIVFALLVLFALAALYAAHRLLRRIFARLFQATPPPAGTGNKATDAGTTGDKTMFGIFGGKDAARAPFRVGMTVVVDPTPFLLAGDAIKVRPPETSPGGLTNVKSVGVLNGSALTIHRLYLTDGDFLQIHLDPKGVPDECRLFHVVDEVEPATKAEWRQWLDERDGMIGWRDFQTPDGKTYQRAWSPGPARIPPARFHETEDGADGMTLTKYECMLYRADTGLTDPAPQTEYLLVSLTERDGQAWIEIAAGVDVVPASLSLT